MSPMEVFHNSLFCPPFRCNTIKISQVVKFVPKFYKLGFVTEIKINRNQNITLRNEQTNLNK